MPLAPTPKAELLAPVKVRFIVLSLLAALIFNLLPWPDVRGVPDLVAVVIMFWVVHQPQRVGFAVAFLLGLLVDAANGALFGQHALAYVFLAFGADALHRRMLRFGLWPQALHVGALLLVASGLMVLIRMIAGSTLPGPSYFLGSLIGAALWPLVSLLLLAPQRAGEAKESSL